MEMVDSFVYLGCLIRKTGVSVPEITRRITIARNSMKTLDKPIWRLNISLQTKICLYNCYILPVFLYGAEIWTIIDSVEKKLDAFDCWCLRRILHIPYTKHIKNKEVRERTNPRSVLQSEAEECDYLDILLGATPSLSDHSRALKAGINAPTRGWKRPRGRPRHTWIGSVKDDLRRFNLGLLIAWRKAQDRQQWHNLVEKATSSRIRYR